MPNLELELTYLAASIPEKINQTNPIRLIDIYIPQDPDVHAKLRIRKKGDTYVMTKKILLKAGDASKQNEYDIPLDEREFNELSKISDRKIIKDRYQIMLGGKMAEVDIFRDNLKGLVVIDFEFETFDDQKSFIAPKECLADVTQEDFIAGGNLAGLEYSDIQTHLTKFNYQKL